MVELQVLLQLQEARQDTWQTGLSCMYQQRGSLKFVPGSLQTWWTERAFVDSIPLLKQLIGDTARIRLKILLYSGRHYQLLLATGKETRLH